MAFPLDPEKTAPMEARAADALPPGKAWQFEPKWDGFRCLAFRDGAKILLQGKSGKPLTLYFPEVAAALAVTKVKRFVLDGELVIPLGESLSFDALQARLHPAESRRRKLAAQTPARLVLFDLLAGGESLVRAPLTERRSQLEKLFKAMGKSPFLLLSPQTRDRAEARRWLGQASKGALDGIVAKPLTGAYRMGERAMVKVKHYRSADCVVGGFRYASGTRLVGSLLLGLYDDEGKLDHVGFTSGITDAQRPALTRKLKALEGGSGFTGNAPGGPSRWSTERSGEWVALKPSLVAEVRYDHFSGGRFRHGTRFLRWRPDKKPRACSFDQLAAHGAARSLDELMHP
jgi:ATP-dependent DNA ligase